MLMTQTERTETSTSVPFPNPLRFLMSHLSTYPHLNVILEQQRQQKWQEPLLGIEPNSLN